MVQRDVPDTAWGSADVLLPVSCPTPAQDLGAVMPCLQHPHVVHLVPKTLGRSEGSSWAADFLLEIHVPQALIMFIAKLCSKVTFYLVV